jgi:hypothetical protein
MYPGGELIELRTRIESILMLFGRRMDFFNDMVVNVTLAQTSATVGLCPQFGAYIGAQDQASTSTARASATENTTTGVYTKYVQDYVDLQGNLLTPGVTAVSNFVRYAEYPGERLFKKVKFEVNGNPLDEYTAEAMVFHQKFRVAPNKLVGWKRLVGQEVPIEAYSDPIAITGTSKWPSLPNPAPVNANSGPLDLLDQSGEAVVGAPVSSATTARKLVQVVNGPQTPKAVQPALDLWVPLTALVCA